MNSAVIVFSYERPKSFNRLVNSILNANYCKEDNIDLIISCDYSGNEEIKQISSNIEWEHGKKIELFHPSRLGLRNHIMKCFEQASNYDFIIVLEDDLVVSDSFYMYGREAAKFYDNDDNIAGVSLYSYQKNWLAWSYRFEPQKTQYDTYFMRIAQSWGELFTKKQWLRFKDWYEKNIDFKRDKLNPARVNTWPDSSWLKYFVRYCILNDKYLVYPYHSLTTNCSELGEHNASLPVNDYHVDLIEGQDSFRFPIFDKEDYKCVRYDEYMNRMGLDKLLSIDDLVVDLWATKDISNISSGYLLTTRTIKNTELVCSYPLSYKPIEYPVVHSLISNNGNIHLYKINGPIKVRKDNKDKLLEYTFRTHELGEVSKLHNLLVKFMISKVFNKIKNTLRKKK